MNKTFLPVCLVAACTYIAAPTLARADVFNMPSGQTSLATVRVGDTSNQSDPTTGYGAVGYVYQMGKYDVTYAQYAQFLNAKAASDPYGLWNDQMGTYGLTRSGTAGSYTYSVNSGLNNQPVVAETWYDTLRFANWLSNGQGNGDTENGSYTLLGGTPQPSNYATITRNTGAQWVLPTENEWYKSAYYDSTLNSGSGGYWVYATKSNTISNSMANFSPVVQPSDVGSYPYPSAYGTFDQVGDVWQWNEANINGDGSKRGLRGGAFGSYYYYLQSSYRPNDVPPTMQSIYYGFRVAEVAVVPEPNSIALAIAGVGSVLVFARRRVIAAPTQ
jgi:formylglycine-generating enzyme required for sulfatase activity